MEIVAHRGASAYAPEHSFEAYDLALELGADGLEVDLRLTADRRLLAVHDATLLRILGRPDAVGKLTTADLLALPQPTRPLLLRQILHRYRQHTRLLLELKDPAPPMERRLVAAITRARIRSDIVVQSFSESSLRRIRRLAPDLPVAPLVEHPPANRAEWLDRVVSLGAAAVGVRADALDRDLVDAAHARGLAVRAWTVNTTEETCRLAHLGVDGLITDVPDLVASATRPVPVAQVG